MRHGMLVPDGYVEVADADGNVVRRDTMQCRHCGGHFVVVPGSGTRRGFCMCCAGPTCGNPACDPCDHFMRKIERLERAERGNR